MATSGIEDTIKLWAPSAEEPQARARGAHGACMAGGPSWQPAAQHCAWPRLATCPRGLAAVTRAARLPTLPCLQVIGPAQERVMAANERSQGEDRRIFLTPQMLQVGRAGCAARLSCCAG